MHPQISKLATMQKDKERKGKGPPISWEKPWPLANLWDNKNN